jgi:hypothetical protein
VISSVISRRTIPRNGNFSNEPGQLKDKEMEDILLIFMVTALLTIPIMRRPNGLQPRHDNNVSVDYETPQVNLEQPVVIESTMMISERAHIIIEDLPQEQAA